MNQLMMVTKSRRYIAIVHKTLFSRFRMELHSVHVHLTLLWDSSSLWFHLRHLTHSSFTVFAKSHTPLAKLKQMLAHLLHVPVISHWISPMCQLSCLCYSMNTSKQAETAIGLPLSYTTTMNVQMTFSNMNNLEGHVQKALPFLRTEWTENQRFCFQFELAVTSGPH